MKKIKIELNWWDVPANAIVQRKGNTREPKQQATRQTLSLKKVI